MIAEIVEKDSPYRLIRVEEREPVCGEDFCDTCGDCLACYNEYCEDGCRFVVYVDERKENDGRS